MSFPDDDPCWPATPRGDVWFVVQAWILGLIMALPYVVTVIGWLRRL